MGRFVLGALIAVGTVLGGAPLAGQFGEPMGAPFRRLVYALCNCARQGLWPFYSSTALRASVELPILYIHSCCGGAWHRRSAMTKLNINAPTMLQVVQGRKKTNSSTSSALKIASGMVGGRQPQYGWRWLLCD